MSAEKRLRANFCRPDPVAGDFLDNARNSRRPGQEKADFRPFGQSAVKVSSEASLLTFLTHWSADPCRWGGKYYPQKRLHRIVASDHVETTASSAGYCWNARQTENLSRSSHNKISEREDIGTCIRVDNNEEHVPEAFSIMNLRRKLLVTTCQYCRNAAVHCADVFLALVPIEWSSSDAAV